MIAASIRAAIPHAKPLTIVSSDGVTVYDLPDLLEQLARRVDAEAAAGVFRDQPFSLFGGERPDAVPTVTFVLRELCRLAAAIPLGHGISDRYGMPGTAGIMSDDATLTLAFVGQFRTRMDYREAVAACRKVFPQADIDQIRRVP